MRIALNVRAIRKTKNMTQEDLAEKIYLSPASVRNIERGKTHPSLETLCMFAKVLDCKLDDLVNIDD